MKAFIDNTMWYSITWLMAFLLAGIIWYILDRQYFTRLASWVYNLLHKDPLPDGKKVGVVYGHKTKWLVFIATFVSTVQSAGLFFFTGFHSNPFVELVLWFFEIPAMIVGFYVGGMFYPVWQKRDVLYTGVDKLNERIVNRTASKPDASPAKSEATGAAVVPEQKAPTPAPPEEDPMDLINQFANRDRRKP